MEQPPHPMLIGDDEGDYYRGTFRTPSGSATASTGETSAAASEEVAK
jgi:hypothetical protein